MAWTYDITAFQSVAAGTYVGSTVGDRYLVRLYIQDTNTNRQLFQDEEIDITLTQQANKFMAAASLCDTLVAKAGGVRNKKIGDFSIGYDPVFYQTLSAKLRAQGAGHQAPFAGGISIAEKGILQGDPDWVPAALPRGLDNNPAAPAAATPSTNPLTTI